jgi:hypothetical protein
VVPEPRNPAVGLMYDREGGTLGYRAYPMIFPPTGDTKNTSPVGRCRHEKLMVDGGGQGLDMVFGASRLG